MFLVVRYLKKSYKKEHNVVSTEVDTCVENDDNTSDHTWCQKPMEPDGEGPGGQLLRHREVGTNVS